MFVPSLASCVLAAQSIVHGATALVALSAAAAPEAEADGCAPEEGASLRAGGAMEHDAARAGAGGGHTASRGNGVRALR